MITKVPNKSDRERRGIECPRCGCRQFRVIYTRAVLGEKIVRRRECRHCGKRILTAERQIG